MEEKIDWIGNIALIAGGLGAFYIMRKYAGQKFASTGQNAAASFAEMVPDVTQIFTPSVPVLPVTKVLTTSTPAPVPAVINEIISTPVTKPSTPLPVTDVLSPVTKLSIQQPGKISTKQTLISQQLLYGINLRA
jgi:hypothetical protein